jgi:ligand-binding sensor domain-containing protein
MSRYRKSLIRARRILFILMLAGLSGSLFASYSKLPEARISPYNQVNQAIPRVNDFKADQNDASNWQAYLNPYNFSAMIEDGDYLWFASPMGVLKHNTLSGQTELINTANSGINSNFVSDMMLHSSGDYWFAHTTLVSDDNSCGGISILHPDGSWTVWNYENAPFHSNNIMCLGEDDIGRVWIGYGMNGYSEGGMSMYDPSNGEWQYFNKHNSDMPSNTVYSFHLAADGKLWVSLTGDVDPDPYEGGGLMSIQGYDWQVYTTQIADDPAEPLKEWSIKNIVEDSQGNLWFALSGSVDTALYQYDGENFIRYEAPFVAMYWDVAIDAQDNIYVNGIVSRVYKFDGTNWTTLPDPDAIADGNYIQNIWMDSNSKLWVALYDGYLVTYENDTYTYPNLELDSPVKGLNSFWTMDSDGLGNTYFGTGWYVWGAIPTAASLMHWDESQWQSFNYTSYQNYVVNDIAWDMQGKLLIATGDSNSDAANLFDMYGSVCRQTENGWIKYDYETTGYPFIYAKLAQEDYNAFLWAGTNTNGLAVYDGVDWTVYDSNNVPNMSVMIMDILASHNEPVVWVATASGIFRVDISDSENYIWEHYHPLNSELPAWCVNTLAWDADGSLLIGTESGLARFQNNELSVMQDLDGVYITDLSMDENGDLWLGTISNGLLCVADDSVTAYTRSNSPLPSNTIYYVASDQRGTLWIHPHNNGLYRMDYNSSTADDPALPRPVAQLKNYPNPFNPETAISFELPEANDAKIGIYNLKGQLVKSYPKARYPGGIHQISWDGKSDQGVPCSSGIYFVRVQSDNYSLNHKMTLMK